jgi:hypothetical protein
VARRVGKTVVAKSLGKSGILGNGGRIGSKVLGPSVAVVFVAWEAKNCWDECNEIETAYYCGEITKETKIRMQNRCIGRTVGGSTGGILGGIAGGALAGAACSGPLAPIGAFIGAVAGGFAGSSAGSWGGEAAADAMSPQEQEMRDCVSELQKHLETQFLAMPVP